MLACGGVLKEGLDAAAAAAAAQASSSSTREGVLSSADGSSPGKLEIFLLSKASCIDFVREATTDQFESGGVNALKLQKLDGGGGGGGGGGGAGGSSSARAGIRSFL
jgi:hypothetical protein